MDHYPPVRQMIREAVEELGSPATNTAVRYWVEANYPGTNRGTIDARRMMCTVNQPSRIHYPEHQRARPCSDPRFDFLYRPARGELGWYRPEQHGVWSIEQDEGDFAICCDDGELIYPQRRECPAVVREPAAPRPPRTAISITQAQIDAARRLHELLAQWASTDRAFERLAES